MEVELVYYPDPRLRDVAEAVDTVDDPLRALITQMFEIMYRARGIGLAGPQVGLGRRIVVANLAADSKRKEDEQVFINPTIIESSGDVREEEGCLSLPGMVAQIQRAEVVLVRYRDLEGNEVQRPVEALEAKLFQHEIDHLDGILILDKMTPADKKQWAPLLKELEQDFQSKRKPRGKGAHKPGL